MNPYSVKKKNTASPQATQQKVLLEDFNKHLARNTWQETPCFQLNRKYFITIQGVTQIQMSAGIKSGFSVKRNLSFLHPDPHNDKKFITLSGR
jgi:hypothetical protein